MKGNEININDLSFKLESLSTRCDILETKNNEYEKRIKRNEEVIVNLNKQLIILNKKYNKIINEMKQDYISKYEKLIKALKDKNIIKNEILINEEKNNKENNKKIIEDNGGTLMEKFENQLFNIFSNNKNKDVSIVDIYKLKKLSAALLIKDKNIKSPLEMSKLFLEKNMNINDTDESTKINIKLKRSDIYNEINDVQLRKIDKNDKANFMKEFKEKYGILDEDISEKELKFEIEYRNYNENEIIKIVLIRLGYI